MTRTVSFVLPPACRRRHCALAPGQPVLAARGGAVWKRQPHLGARVGRPTGSPVLGRDAPACAAAEPSVWGMGGIGKPKGKRVASETPPRLVLLQPGKPIWYRFGIISLPARIRHPLLPPPPLLTPLGSLRQAFGRTACDDSECGANPFATRQVSTAITTGSR